MKDTGMAPERDGRDVAPGAALEALPSDALESPHGFFTRAGGVSQGVYAGLQCGYGAKEDDAAHVDENRRRARAELGPSAHALVTAYQQHTPRALAVSDAWEPHDAPVADALATRTPGLAIGVLTADCAPVLLEDAEAGVVGAAHAGWKGALGGVLEASIDVMEALGAQRGRIAAAIGPTIGADSYEVGPEFVARFLEGDPGSAGFFSAPTAPDALAAGKAQFDLPGYVERRLKRAGVAKADWIGADTYPDASRFYSNRRALHLAEADYGRLLSAIMVRARA